MKNRIPLIAMILAMTGLPGPSSGEERAHPGPLCSAESGDYFAEEVWTMVGARSCLKCHKAGGDAEESDFVLRDPSREALGDEAAAEALAHNRAAFARMASLPEGNQSRLLLKPLGKLDHGGEEVLEAGSTGYRILEEFVRRTTGAGSREQVAAARITPFFEGVGMIDDRKLLRRLSLALAARLPAPEENAAVARNGRDAIGPALDGMMTGEAFYDRLAEGFNDIFLTPGIDDVAENVLSYEHFEKTRHWYQHWDFSAIADERERERAGWKLAADYRDSMEREPMELVKHIVRNGRPFTELITADYIMVSPFTSRGYGIFEEIRDRFADPENRLEYVPVRIAALKGRSRKTDQDSATGFYPHAGILSTFQWLKRYPTTETNRNRLRVRTYFQQFLGIDIMQLAPRVNDSAAITARYEVPTMQAADCVVCHKIIDPVAGLFQDYSALDGNGVYQKRDEGWYQDMFGPGFEGEALPEPERWRALQWLGERTARDPRFAVAMVGHVWYILTGRRPLQPPENIDDPLYAARQRAYEEQHGEFEEIARRFAAAGFNLKTAFRELAMSRFYRADGLAAMVEDPSRKAELDDLGVARLLSPEQLERKITAVFGRKWGRLDEHLRILYGGIDSKEVTERIADPSGAMGAIQHMMANEVACRNVALDFTLEPRERRLFPGIEPDVLPGAETEERLRSAIVHLHELILGRFDSPSAPEVTRTYSLFSGIVTEARERGNAGETEIYSCRAEPEQSLADPHYTLRAWRAVVTYLLRQHDFLYE